MVTQYAIILVICVATISMLFLVSRQKNSGQARMESEAQKAHEEQTRMMTQRLADTGTEWRIAQDEANSQPDPEDLVDQSIEAQFERQ